MRLQMYSRFMLPMKHCSRLATSRSAVLPRCFFTKIADISMLPLNRVSFYSIDSAKSIDDRVLNALKTFNDKIDVSKLTMDCDLAKDLGLDSLDMVEAIIAIEEEFGMEIPDSIADRIKTPADAAAYVKKDQERARVQ